MSTVIKMNKVVMAELFDKVISSANETERLLAEKGINLPGSVDENVIRLNFNSKHIRYINREQLPKGMEAHIIALIKGALS